MGMAGPQATGSWVMRDAPDKIQNGKSKTSLFHVRKISGLGSGTRNGFQKTFTSLMSLHR
ncbi:hypothetical protein ColTof4_11431 [Colletotrichum tofieldiae]|uniref:Uncharacterized protein n=1 Tax=Colletotrichum liriopes TaxID=708192 RepID=A0AA37GKQ5_9PEZI|nr:hypothetical protein ColLi_05248 [Colletotrichum liriopes]GKT79008.1 hypothetical protein ColTof4_11431 [Colletotrichum tofieldiae]